MGRLVNVDCPDSKLNSRTSRDHLGFAFPFSLRTLRRLDLSKKHYDLNGHTRLFRMPDLYLCGLVALFHRGRNFVNNRLVSCKGVIGLKWKDQHDTPPFF